MFPRRHETSRNTLSLTAHVVHTAVSNPLISLACRSYPSGAHSKICAQKTVFSRSSSLFSSFHCTHSAHEWVTAHVPYSPSPPHFSIGKAVNIREMEFSKRILILSQCVYWAKGIVQGQSCSVIGKLNLLVVGNGFPPYVMRHSRR